MPDPVSAVLLAPLLLLLLGGSDAAGQAPRWELVWQDEFSGEVIDTGKWDLEENCWGGGNNEQQCYTGRRDKHPRRPYIRVGLIRAYVMAVTKAASGN